MKAICDAFDDDTVDGLALESDEGEDEGSTKAFLLELHKLAEQASERFEGP